MQADIFLQDLLTDLGTQYFPGRLQRWVAESLGLPAIYYSVAIRYRRQYLQKNTPYRTGPVETLFFSVRELDPSLVAQALALYTKEGEWRRDEILPYINEPAQKTARGFQQVVLPHRDYNEENAYWTLFKRCKLGMECTLLSYDQNYVYAYSLFRERGMPDFSQDELKRLREQGSTILALLDKHMQLYNLHTNMAQTLVGLFTARLVHADVYLSDREYEVCCGLLSGSSVEQLAQTLMVQPSSVRTYLERALLKLDLPNKWALFSWCVTGPDVLRDLGTEALIHCAADQLPLGVHCVVPPFDETVQC